MPRYRTKCITSIGIHSRLMNEPALHVLAYLSSAATLPTQSDLDAILAQARHRNKTDGITGLLLYHDGNFFQVLEGPKNAVEACYGRIAADLRHHGQIVVLSDRADGRRFSDWTMAYVPFAKLDPVCRKGFLDLRALRDSDNLPGCMNNDEVSIFIRSFIENLSGR